MSDITHGGPHVSPLGGAPTGARIEPKSRSAASRPWPLVPYVVVVFAGAMGLLTGHASGGDATAFEDKLLLLLRFMAVMKFAGVIAAAGLLHWRFRRTIAWRVAVAYAAALAAMAFAAGLIWSLGAIAAGAFLFHVGLLAFLVLAWRDDGVQLPRRR